ncbi:hypothetical protein CXB65_13400 [Pseudomonas monteilii]|uniref:Uncharacterized protein n=1 Tax=Pseudomonas monteilii TaxID=76759 RepID=A0A2N1IRX0_9PSED|nr:hypothetical protein B7H19_16645 [Pseudomonas putida]PKI22310.1 hypothetical protein CXB65_13400 [Pseudomonas monteilii]
MRACPRSRRRGGWHGLRPCSRARPLPQGASQLLDFKQDSCCHKDGDFQASSFRRCHSIPNASSGERRCLPPGKVM